MQFMSQLMSHQNLGTDRLSLITFSINKTNLQGKMCLVQLEKEKFHQMMKQNNVSYTSLSKK